MLIDFIWQNDKKKINKPISSALNSKNQSGCLPEKWNAFHKHLPSLHASVSKMLFKHAVRLKPQITHRNLGVCRNNPCETGLIIAVLFTASGWAAVNKTRQLFLIGCENFQSKRRIWAARNTSTQATAGYMLSNTKTMVIYIEVWCCKRIRISTLSI